MNEPRSNQPGPSQPGPSQPSPNQPSPNQPSPNQPSPNQPSPSQPSPNQPRVSEPGTDLVGTRVVHRRYVPYSHAHYAGNLVDGAYVLALFGDVATELSIRTDGDEGLFASYSDVQFRGPLRGGDVVEVSATLVRRGRRSREMAFEAHVVCRGTPERSASAAEVLAAPLLITSARGTVVVAG